MKYNKIWLLALILLCALVLRVYQIERESLWLDEGFSVSYARMTIGELMEEGTRETHPPLYYILLHFWIKLLGDSEFAMRFFSVMCNLITIVVVYRIGNLLYNSQAGLLASLLISLSAFNVQYSQEVRNYALVALLSALSLLYLVKLLKETSNRDAVFYLIFSSLLMYTHVVSAFVVLATQNVFVFMLFIFSRTPSTMSLKRWIFLQVSLLLVFMPWIANLAFRGSLMTNLVAWIPSPSLATIKENLQAYAGSRKLLFMTALVLPFSVVCLKKSSGHFNLRDPFGTLEGYRWDVSLHFTEKASLLFLWAFLPMAMLFVISKVASPVYLIKVTIGASLGFYLLVAAALNHLANRYVKVAAVIVIALLALNSSRQFLERNRKEGWRQATHYIENHATQGDLLIFNSGSCLKTVFKYYAQRDDLVPVAFPEKGKRVTSENIKLLPAVLVDRDKVWLILSHTGDKKGLMEKMISQDYDLITETDYFKEITIKRFRLK